MVLDLGVQPAASTFLAPDELASAERTWPLRVLICTTCWLMQLEDGPQEGSGGMPIVTWSGAMERHGRAYADALLERLDAGGTNANRLDAWRIVETASHGNYLQSLFGDLGISTLIAEASGEWAVAARAEGRRVERVAIAPGAGRWIERRLGGPADALVDYYLLAHLREPAAFLAGVAEVIGADGLAAIEFDHLLPVIEEGQFDAIRHGHFSYLSFLALESALQRVGLAAFDVEELDVYGGAIRAWVQDASSSPRAVGRAVVDLRDREQRAGLRGADVYRRYRRSVERTLAALRGFLEEARGDGRLVAGYGAPSRGNTLLNSCGITPELLPFTVDRSPAKQGRLLPGSRIPIHPPSHLADVRPDFILVLAWDLVDEIRGQLPEVGAWGGRFVVPIPEVTVLP